MLVEGWVPAMQQSAVKNNGLAPERKSPVRVTRDFYRAELARWEDSCVVEPALQNAGACVTERGGGVV